MEKLPKYTHENGIDYVLVGDYYIPMLTLPEENRPGYYSSLLLTGKLWTYLADLDEQAQERLDRIMEQMKVAEGVTEKLKADDQLKWIQRMNSICKRAEEIIREEMIYI